MIQPTHFSVFTGISVHFERDSYAVSEDDGNITVEVLKLGANGIPVTITVSSQGPDATGKCHDCIRVLKYNTR